MAVSSIWEQYLPAEPSTSFNRRISHSNGYLSECQQLLGASLHIERRPDQCVVFDTSPFFSVSAHEFDMRTIALIGPYPRYELLTADLSTSSVNELTIMNIRSLFGDRMNYEPEVDMASPRQPDTRKRVQTTYEWAGDDQIPTKQ